MVDAITETINDEKEEGVAITWTRTDSDNNGCCTKSRQSAVFRTEHQQNQTVGASLCALT